MSDLVTNFGLAAEFSGIHTDTYAGSKETPLQGPFTEKYVGGKQHRHVDLNVITSSTDTLDTPFDRPEGWKLKITSNTLNLYGPDVDDVSHARSIYYRDEYAKRPVNIKNIRQQTGFLPRVVPRLLLDFWT
jgi:hypothetical protein